MQTQDKLKLNDIIIMKKPHACGSSKWKVIRLGTDLKLECNKCGHQIMMDRIELYKKIKKKVSDINEEKQI